MNCTVCLVRTVHDLSGMNCTVCLVRTVHDLSGMNCTVFPECKDEPILVVPEDLVQPI